MKELIAMNEFGLMAGTDCIARVDSRKIAEVFEKEHKDVLRAIKNAIGEESGYSREFTERNFAPSKYVDSTGRKLPCYLLTRDGFVALAMGFTGKKADGFKEQYIRLFNEMEQQILTLQSLKDQFPMLTEALRDMTEDPKPYIYSNEADMLNRIALGMSAKKYREQHGIPKTESIRAHLTAKEADMLERLQHMDVGLVYAGLSFRDRQHRLEWYAWSKSQPTLTEEGQPSLPAA